MVNKRTRPKSSGKTIDDFEITPKLGRDIEKRLNGIERSNKLMAKEILGGSITKLKCRNPKQKEFLKLIEEKEITICIGPAGCGKSYLSVYKAFQLLLDPDNNYERIAISTPAVEADEKLGFLPGDVKSKLDPYLYSTFYLMEKLIGSSALSQLMEKGIIEIIPFAFMRGINIDKTILLGEELQNSTPKQMKTLLSRIGEDSKFILSGDYSQSDRFKYKEQTGLYDALYLLEDEHEVGTFEFDLSDVVRNPLVGKILTKYEAREEAREKEKALKSAEQSTDKKKK